MTNPQSERVEALMADLAEQRRTSLEQVRQQAAITGTATSGKGLLTVELGAQGEITSLVFHSRSYRQMAPAELADVIMQTVERARHKVLEQVLATLPSTVLGDVPLADLVSGEADVTQLTPGGAVGASRTPAPDSTTGRPTGRPR